MTLLISYRDIFIIAPKNTCLNKRSRLGAEYISYRGLEDIKELITAITPMSIITYVRNATPASMIKSCKPIDGRNIHCKLYRDGTYLLDSRSLSA